MWVGKVLMSQLKDRSSWKVEFYHSDASVKTTTTFNLVPLRNVVVERRETLDPQLFPEQVFDYIGLENIQSVTGDLVGSTKQYGRDIRSRSKVFQSGDILYGRLRPYLNKVYVADEPVSKGICSGEFYVLIPIQDVVLPNFLRSVLASQYVQQYVSLWQTGSALPRLQIDDLLGIEIPLPPLEIQQLFEEYLICENQRRRRLLSELELLPRKIIDSVVHALESGSSPTTIALIDQYR